MLPASAIFENCFFNAFPAYSVFAKFYFILDLAFVCVFVCCCICYLNKSQVLDTMKNYAKDRFPISLAYGGYIGRPLTLVYFLLFLVL